MMSHPKLAFDSQEESRTSLTARESAIGNGIKKVGTWPFEQSRVAR
jgi:hypothetical protein